jgi:hypothetical protein
MNRIIRNIAIAIIDPGARRIEHRRFVDEGAALALQPVVEPFEIRIAHPKIAGVDEVVFVGADPLFLGASPGLDLVERGDHAGLKDVEPGGDMKARYVDGAAEIVPGAEGVVARMGDDLVKKRLPGREVRIGGQRQQQPIG